MPCSRACGFCEMKGDLEWLKPSKAEQSSLEARSVCEKDKIVSADATTLQNQKTFEKGTRAGALELKSFPSNFQFPSP